MLFIPKKRTHLLFYYIVLNIFIAIQKIAGFHAGLTSQLQLIDLKQEVASGDIEHTLIDHNHTWTHTRILLGLCGLKDLQINRLAIRSHQGSPGTGIRTQTTDEIVDTFGRTLPVDLTDILKQFRRIIEMLELPFQLLLRDALGHTIGSNAVSGISKGF